MAETLGMKNSPGRRGAEWHESSQFLFDELCSDSDSWVKVCQQKICLLGYDFLGSVFYVDLCYLLGAFHCYTNKKKKKLGTGIVCSVP